MTYTNEQRAQRRMIALFIHGSMVSPETADETRQVLVPFAQIANLVVADPSLLADLMTELGYSLHAMNQDEQVAFVAAFKTASTERTPETLGALSGRRRALQAFPDAEEKA